MSPKLAWHDACYYTGMVNQLLRVLIAAVLPMGLVSCIGSDETFDDDAASSESETGAGGHSENAGGQSGSGGRSSGGAPTSGGASASGGYQILPSENLGGMGFAGEPQAPEDLDCPPEQWVCQNLTCTRGEAKYVTEPGDCVCDRSRPVSADDCDEDLRFECHYLDPAVAERGLSACACVDPDLSSLETCSSHPFYVGERDGEHCACLQILTR